MDAKHCSRVELKLLYVAEHGGDFKEIEPGMVVYINSPKVRETRSINVQLVLSYYDCKCATCLRSSNCSLSQMFLEFWRFRMIL